MKNAIILFLLMLNIQNAHTQKIVTWNYFSFKIPEHWKAEENFLKTFQIYHIFKNEDKEQWLLMNIKEQKGGNLDTTVSELLNFVERNQDRFELQLSKRTDNIHRIRTYDKQQKLTELINLIEIENKIYKQSFWYVESYPKNLIEEGINIFSAIQVLKQKGKEPIFQKIIKAPQRLIQKIIFKRQIKKIAKIMKKTAEQDKSIQNTDNQ